MESLLYEREHAFMFGSVTYDHNNKIIIVSHQNSLGYPIGLTLPQQNTFANLGYTCFNKAGEKLSLFTYSPLIF